MGNSLFLMERKKLVTYMAASLEDPDQGITFLSLCIPYHWQNFENDSKQSILLYSSLWNDCLQNQLIFFHEYRTM